MKFARVVFTVAGIWGLVVVTPLYFAFDLIGQRYPPAVTHADFYYGFVAVALAWQIAFLAIGRAPERLRPMMLPAACEKAFYVVTLVTLHGQGRIELGQAVMCVPDFILGCLFIVAYLRVRPEAA